VKDEKVDILIDLEITYLDALILLEELKSQKNVINVAIYKKDTVVDVDSIDIDYFRRLDNLY